MGALENYKIHEQRDGLTKEEEIEDLKLKEEPKKSPFDNAKNQKRLRRVRAWWRWVRSVSLENREERMKAHDYYDGEQWEAEDKAEVEERGQRASVFNLIKPNVDWITGTEKKTRVDWQILPRRKDAAKAATAKTKTIKYISDTSKAPFNRSASFEDATISGLGWIDTGVRTNESGPALFNRYEDWRNVWHDPLGVERDLSDGRFLFRHKYLDFDVACAMFPDRVATIKASAHSEGTYYEQDADDDEIGLEYEIEEAGDEGGLDGMACARSRVRVIECQYREPARVKILRGKDLGSLDGTIYDEDDAAQKHLVDSGYVSLFDGIRMVMRRMLFVEKGILDERECPYNHQKFSLVPIWAWRRKRDGMPFGAVKNQIDPQDDLNKRRSKALFILSNNRVIADEGAVDDVDEAWEEIQRPDGWIEKKKGYQLEIQNDTTLAREHIMLMDQDAKYIEATSGVTDENKGLETNATSGKAIRFRQDQGHVNVATIFDNYRFSFKLVGEINLSLAEQFLTEEQVIRITGDKGQVEWLDINKENPETGEIENDITADQADFIVDAQNFSATIRQAMFESLGEMLTRLDPQVALALLDLWVDLSDLPGKDLMVQRIRQINGQPDPDEDPEDPEVIEKEAAEEAAKQRAQEIQQQLENLEIAAKGLENKNKSADTKKLLAMIDEIAAKIQKMGAETKNEAADTRLKGAELLHKIEQDEKADKESLKSESGKAEGTS